MVKSKGLDDGFTLLDQRVAALEMVAATDLVEVEVLVLHEVLNYFLVRSNSLLELLC